MSGTEELLNERGKTHGAFIQNAKVGQAIRRALRESIATVGAEVPDRQMEALDYIAGKLSRIVAAPQGWKVKDHWDDIAGYAKLATMSDEDDYKRAGVTTNAEPQLPNLPQVLANMRYYTGSRKRHLFEGEGIVRVSITLSDGTKVVSEVFSEQAIMLKDWDNPFTPFCKDLVKRLTRNALDQFSVSAKPMGVRVEDGEPRAKEA